VQIAERIHRIEAPLGERYIAIYLLVGENAAMLVDTGLTDSIDEVVLPYLDMIGVAPTSLRYVVSTHCDFDHIGGNQSAREHFPHALVLCHRLDQPMTEDLQSLIDERYGEFSAAHDYDDTDDAAKTYIREVARTSPVDVSVSGAERIRLGGDWQVELVHTPGHSWGSLSVWDPRSRTMIVGDAVLGIGLMTRDGQPAFPPTYRYLAAYRETIGRLAAFDAALLATAHYPVYRDAEVADFLALSHGYTDAVERAIVGVLAMRPDGASALEIIAAAHGGLGPWDATTAKMLMYPVIGHLEQLTACGRIQQMAGQQPTRWRICR
jgi:glyoxylase-like metal-dependent hydrolase (beta-lactamase superfamily II)